MVLRTKPRLYIPDEMEYGRPFENVFTLVSGAYPYDHKTLLGCDFLMLTGGADIQPKYYGQEPTNGMKCYYNVSRDEKEFNLAAAALEADIPIIGICRGAQWLSVLAGGTLIQHVENHGGGTHEMETSHPTFPFVSMSSSHHQMCNLSGVDHMLLAWTKRLSKVYRGERDKYLFQHGLDREPEVFYLPAIRGFGVQGHPEYMPTYAEGNQYLRTAINELFDVQ